MIVISHIRWWRWGGTVATQLVENEVETDKITGGGGGRVSE